MIAKPYGKIAVSETLGQLERAWDRSVRAIDGVAIDGVKVLS